MRTLIIDDETLARDNLKQLFNSLTNEIDVIGEASGVAEGVKLIRKHKPDIVFCDIEMPVLNGLQLLDFFEPEEVNFELIFATSHSEFAIQAFRLSAIDYLLKPIDPDHLQSAINKVAGKLSAHKSERFQLLKENVSQPIPRKIAIPKQDGYVFIEIDNIVWLKADNVYTDVALKNGQKIVVSRTLKEFEKSLPEKLFFRSHRSYIINKNEIIGYSKSEGGFVVMSDHNNIPLSTEKREDFTAFWSEWKI
jgi:two-component system LytT family response regulator